jgi:hypothetical protein
VMQTKKKRIRFNSEFLVHFVYKLHKHWVFDSSFVNEKERVKNNEREN